MQIAGFDHIQTFAKSSSDSRAAFSHLCLVHASKSFYEFAWLDRDGKLLNANRYKVAADVMSLDLPENNRIILGIQSDYATLVPEQLFSKEHASQYLTSQLSENTANLVILHNHIPSIQSYMVYGVDAHLLNSAETLIPNSLVVDSSIGLIHHWSLSAKQKQAPVIFIHWQQTSIEITAWDNGKLVCYTKQVANSFEDIPYLTFYLMDQLSAEYRTAPIYYSGAHEQQEDIISIFKRYHNQFIPDNQFNTPYLSGLEVKVSSEEFTHLLSLVLCA